MFLTKAGVLRQIMPFTSYMSTIRSITHDKLMCPTQYKLSFSTRLHKLEHRLTPAGLDKLKAGLDQVN